MGDCTKYNYQTLRENYIQKKVFQIGQLVENLNTGLIGRIIRRGTNYLICVTEDKIMLSWIKDVTEAVVNGTTKSVLDQIKDWLEQML